MLVFLRDGAAGVPTHAIPQAASTGSEVARSRQWREVGLGAQILKDLGVRSIRLLSTSQHTYVGLGGYEAGGGGGGRAGGLGVVGTSPSHGCAPPGSGSGGSPVPMCEWIRSRALRRNSRARRLEGSRRYASSQARTASIILPLR